LIHMENDGIQNDMDGSLRKNYYKDWSYVVDSKTGNILKIYKTKDVPPEWWKF